MIKESNPREEGTVVYTRYITLKNGKRIFASAYGLESFRIVVRNPKR
jgi:hypothetical protein